MFSKFSLQGTYFFVFRIINTIFGAYNKVWLYRIECLFSDRLWM